MPDEILAPQLDLLSEEYVLVQAWKKTAAYIRGHNWYADTLELDRTAIDLRRFLRILAERLKRPAEWTNEPLRIVPAPKTQNWRVENVGGVRRWLPVDTNIAGKLRPLAHVAFAEQVAATAVMLCLADRVESLQGDPRQSVASPETRKQTVSYGNRLFCDADGTLLRHRWGSSKLYRAYFTDYEAFLARPERVARDVTTPGRVVIVHSDLRQFYDRVTTSLMSQKLRSAARPPDDPSFYPFVERLLHWQWHRADVREVDSLANASGRIVGPVVLPQGLVASGFLANFVLLEFDKAMSASIGTEIFNGVVLEDYCRYVDDIRMVLAVRDDSPDLSAIETLIATVLQQRLDVDAPGLIVSAEKTIATTVREDVRPIVRQSRRMRSIQHAVSGGFDAVGGEEILASIQGLLGTQNRHTRREDSGWSFAPVPDVRDATVARFAAGRYRTTFRSLRPLLERTEFAAATSAEPEDDSPLPVRAHDVQPRTQADLDDDARVFALGLIDRWVEDPSNVRLLRIGLDLWPAEDVLRNVLTLLRPFTEKGGKRKAPRRVAWYCLAEIFRAGATETAFVEDEESLPESLNPEAYRTALRQEAHRLLALPHQTLPWYLLQQVLLFLAVSERDPEFSLRSGTRAETSHYRDLVRFLRGDNDHLPASEYAILAILARRSYRDADTATRLTGQSVTQERLAEIARRDPTFAGELSLFHSDGTLWPAFRPADLVDPSSVATADGVSLAELVSRTLPTPELRDELSLLSFASIAIPKLVAADMRTVEPDQIIVGLSHVTAGSSRIGSVEIRRREGHESTFTPPDWCSREQQWRFQIGYLLRYILTYGAIDITRPIRQRSWREASAVYRPPESHWYQRVHGSFNAASEFGDDWVPLSSWTEGLLSALLAWPGMMRTAMTRVVEGGPAKVVDAINHQIETIAARRGRSTGLLVIPLRSAWLTPGKEPRPLRGCVVQTVVPDITDFQGDLTLSSPAVRKKHRNHLSASLSAVEKMLALRATHHLHRDRLDWLIFPELAVHPSDIRTHLLPFARAHKTIILAGLTYQSLLPNQPLVNSALWVIPQRTPTGGVDVIRRRQGKCHLASVEQDFNAAGTAVCSFRPCQWVIEYEWNADPQIPPLRLTASICYDATDLKLASDMRDQSDVFAIPAFNRDVLTFDQMALALHYHMFQLVVVANNGLFGGSNAYLPYKDSYKKQVFHMHGQPQASIAFFEIDDIGGFLARKSAAKQASGVSTPNLWKYPPAGT